MCITICISKVPFLRFLVEVFLPGLDMYGSRLRRHVSAGTTAGWPACQPFETFETPELLETLPTFERLTVDAAWCEAAPSSGWRSNVQAPKRSKVQTLQTHKRSNAQTFPWRPMGLMGTPVPINLSLSTTTPIWG